MFKLLWAPWRIKYILETRIKGCVFCHMAKEKSGEDRINLILERNKYSFVVLNKYPYNNGHLMIVPYLHKSKIEDLDDKILTEMMRTAKNYVKKMKKLMRAEGFNIGINIGTIAGAGIADHLHLHIVPRWAGDSNFMPIIGDTKVISESFESVYEKLIKKG